MQRLYYKHSCAFTILASCLLVKHMPIRNTCWEPQREQEESKLCLLSKTGERKIQKWVLSEWCNTAKAVQVGTVKGNTVRLIFKGCVSCAHEKGFGKITQFHLKINAIKSINFNYTNQVWKPWGKSSKCSEVAPVSWGWAFEFGFSFKTEVMCLPINTDFNQPTTFSSAVVGYLKWSMVLRTLLSPMLAKNCRTLVKGLEHAPQQERF